MNDLFYGASQMTSGCLVARDLDCVSCNRSPASALLAVLLLRIRVELWKFKVRPC